MLAVGFEELHDSIHAQCMQSPRFASSCATRGFMSWGCISLLVVRLQVSDSRLYTSDGLVAKHGKGQSGQSETASPDVREKAPVPVHPYDLDGYSRAGPHSFPH